MLDSPTDPQNDIRVAFNDGGAHYEMELAGWQKDTDGHWIPSHYVAKYMVSIPELLGGSFAGCQRPACETLPV